MGQCERDVHRICKAIIRVIQSAELIMLLGILRERSLSPRPTSVPYVTFFQHLNSSLRFRWSVLRYAAVPVQRCEEAARSRLINGAGWNFNDSSAHNFSRTRIRMKTSFRHGQSTTVNSTFWNYSTILNKLFCTVLICCQKVLPFA